MLRFRYLSLLLIALIVTGTGLAFASAQGRPNALVGGIQAGMDDNTYFNQVIVPAKASPAGLTAEQRAWYLGYTARQHGEAGPARDRRGGADDQGYEYRGSDEQDGPAYEWIDIIGRDGTTNWGALDDDDGRWADLGFNFTYYGNQYNRVWVCSNGWMSFTDARRDYWFGGWGQIPNGNAPENWIGVEMADWYQPADGRGSTQFWTDGQGTAVITWNDISYWWAGNSTFQAILTSDGKIKLQYGSTYDMGGYLVGFQNAAKNRGFEISRNEGGFPQENYAITIGNNWQAFEGAGISVRPEAVNFGNRYVGTQTQIDATITNNGGADLVITGWSCGEGQIDLPAMNPGDQLVIQPGGRQVVPVVFDCQNAGAFNSTIDIECNADNANGGVFAVNVSGRGLTAPRITVDPQSIETNLLTGDIEDDDLTISNDGGNPLDFTIEHEIISEPGGRDEFGREVRNVAGGPRRDDAGEVIANFSWNIAGQWSYKSGIAYDADDDLLFLTCYSQNQAAIAEPTGDGGYNVIRAWNTPSNCMNAAYLDGIFYATPLGNQFYYRFDAGGNNIGNMGVNFAAYGVAASQENGLLLGVSGNDDNIHVFAPGGQDVAVIQAQNYWQFVGGGWVYSIGWCDKDKDGMFWVNKAGMIYQLAVNDNWQATGLVRSWATNVQNAQPWDGVGHDKYNVIYGSYGSDHYIVYDDGNAEAYWFGYMPTEGSVAPGGSTVVTVHLDAAGLFTGDYVADLHVLSNDPVTPNFIVNVTAHVTGAPVIAVEWPEAIGFPEVVNFNAAFPDVFVDHDYPVEVLVTNGGTADLEVDGIDSDNGSFTASPDQFVLAPGAEQVVTIVFNSNGGGVHEGMITINSNDANNGAFDINVRAEAFAPPMISFDPGSIETNLLTGDIEEHVITVSNDGNADLRWEAEGEIISEPGGRDAQGRELRSVDGAGPRRDDPGEVLGRFTWAGHGQWSYKQCAYDYDDDLMIVASYWPNGFAVLDPANDYALVREWQPNGNPMGIAYLDGTIYATMWWSQRLAKYDVEGNSLGDMNLNFAPTATGASKDLGYVFAVNSNDCSIAVLTPEGENVATIPGNDVFGNDGGRWTRGICWSDKDSDGPLWINTPNEIHQLSVDTDAWRITGQVQSWRTDSPSGQEWDGLAHDKYNLIYGSYGNQDWVIYEDGVAEMYWLGFTPDAGVIPGGESQEFTVTLNATGLLGGDYVADIHFYNNDPDNADAIVNVVAHVTGAPVIAVEWPEAIGFPNVVNFNQAFLDVFNGAELPVELTVINAGTADLEVDGIDCDNNAFTASPDQFVLGPEAQQIVTVVFNSNQSGVHEGVLTFSSNDANNGQFEVNLRAESSSPPRFGINPGSLEDNDISTGEIHTYDLTLSNTGDALLRWDSDIQIIREPGGRDNRGRDVRNVGPEAVQNDAQGAAKAFALPSTDASWNAISAKSAVQNSGPVSHGGNGAPRRDVPESNYLLVSEAAPWGYDIETDFRAIEGLSYTRIRTPDQLAQVNLGDFDVIYFGNYESDGWTTQYNNHAAEIDDFVDGGGAYYMSTGTNNWGVGATQPGGLVRTAQSYSSNAVSVLTQDENWLMAYEGWDPGHQVHGNSFNHATYSVENLGNIENTDGYQVLFMATDQGELPAVVQYNYGRGQVIAAGTTDGFLQNNYNRDGEWGWAMRRGDLLLYLDILANMTQWVSIDPDGGTIDPGAETNVVLTLDATGLLGGDYEADVLFLTNDPANLEYRFNVLMTVTGRPVISAEWNAAFGFPEVVDFNRAFDPNLFTGGPYRIAVTVNNDGTEDLEVDDIVSDNGAFSANPTQFVVSPGESAVVDAILNANADGVHEGTLTIQSNAHNGDIDINVRGETMAPPIASVDPNALEADLATGETTDLSFAIQNDGDAMLRWTSEFTAADAPARDASGREVRNVGAGPRRDDPGDVIANFSWNIAGQWSYKSGIAYNADDDLLFLTCYSQNQAAIAEPTGDGGYNVIRTWNTPSNCMNAAYLNGRYYATPLGNQFYFQFDNDGNNLGNLGVNFAAYGLAASQELGVLFGLSGNDDNIHVFAPGGQDVGVIQAQNYWNFVGGGWVYSIGWCDKDKDGMFWVNKPGQIYQLSVDENWQVTGVINTWATGVQNAQPWDGVGHDKYNLIYGSYGTDHYIVFDDGNAEAYWFSYTPDAGEVESGSSQDVFVHLDAAGLLGGDWLASIFIYTNDPNQDRQTFEIPVTLHVTGAPVIGVEWDESFGGPNNVVDFNAAFDPDLFTGGPYSLNVTVTNLGTDDLVVDDITSDLGDYSASPTQFVLAPEATQMVAITLNAAENGEHNGALTITSNAHNGDYVIRTSGTTSTSPVLSVDPQALQSDLPTGGNEQQVVTVTNDGGSTLRWDTDFQETGAPGGRDAVRREVRNVGAANGPVNNNGLIPEIDGPGFIANAVVLPSTDASWTAKSNSNRVSSSNPQVHQGAPGRDVPESNYLFVGEASPWGYDLEGDFRAIQGLQYTRIRTPDQLNQVNLRDFDVIYFGNYESDAWTNQYNNHRAAIDEFVDGGGTYYMSTGTNNWGSAATHPGGLIRTAQSYSSNAVTTLERGDNWLMDYEGWDPGHQVHGNSFNHATYSVQNLDRIENSEAYQVLFMATDQGQIPAVVVYDFGSGFCVVGGTTDGFLQNNYNREGEWGWAMRRGDLLQYLDVLANTTRWFAWDPKGGSLEPNQSTDVVCTFDATDLVGGDYTGDFTILSNDPNNRGFVVPVTLTVHGAPWFDSSNPIANPFEGAQGIAFPNTFVQAMSSSSISITAGGTDDLVIESVEVADGDDFSTDLQAGQHIVAGTTHSFNVFFHPMSAQPHQGRLTLTTNADNAQEIWWNMTGTGMLPARIETNPAAMIRSAQGIDEQANVNLRITNAGGAGAANLTWRGFANRVDGRDAAGREIRDVNGAVGPARDAAGDVLGRINLRHNGQLGISRDFENNVMWVCHTDQVNGAGYYTGYQWDGNEITGIVADFQTAALHLGGTYYNGVLYGEQWTSTQITRWDVNGNRLDPININFIPMTFACDQERGLLFCTELSAVTVHVLDVNNNFQQVATIANWLNQANNANFRGRLYWAPEHRNGHLWGSWRDAVQNGQSVAYQTNVHENQDGNWTFDIVQNFFVPTDVRSFGLANDGRNMWIGQNANAFVEVVDDGAAEGPEWFSFAPDRGNIRTNQFQDVTCTFNSAGLADGNTYRATLNIESNDPVTPSLVLDVELVTGNVVVNPPPGWDTPVQTDANASVLVEGVTFDQNAVPAGWCIGVFNGNVCSGFEYWEQQAVGVAVWGASEAAPNQFQAGGHMTFKIWDNDAQVDHAATPTFSQGNDVWEPNGFSVCTLAGNSAYTVNVNLGAGWNLISINVQPQADKLIQAGNNAGLPDIRLMTSAFRANLILMKDERGRFYAPRVGANGFNNIPFWNVAEGYQMRLDQAVGTSWTGAKISNQADVPISAGWNMIAYFPDYTLTCARNTNPAFLSISPIIQNVVLAKDVVGRFVSPRNNFSNMQPWRESQGYQINVNANVVLNYPAQRGQFAAAPIVEGPENGAVAGRWAELASTGENMSVLLTKISGVKVADGDQVAAFSTDGRLVGVGTVTDGMVGLAVWGDDASTDAVDGLKAGDAFVLKYWNAKADQVTALSLSSTEVGKGLVYKADEFTAGTAGVSASIPTSYYLGQNYPNPFNGVTRLTFGLPEDARISVRVFDLAGRVVATLVDGELKAGEHTALWNAEGVSTGIYMVKMVAPNFSDTRKVALMK